MKYEKPWLSIEEQTSLLISRGMCGDARIIQDRLSQVGYYRLSGYAHVYKDEHGFFRSGTSIDKVWDLYTFDRQLRLHVLDAIERVEIYLRSKLAYHLAEANGAFGYLERSSLPRLSHKEYLQFMRSAIDCFNRSGESFAVHFRGSYGDQCGMPPYWILVNTLNLGSLKKLYSGAPVNVRKKIADELGVPTKVLDSWLLSLNTVRNVCAHHSRLWNKPFGTKPMIPRSDERWHHPYEVCPDRLFGILTILCSLLRTIAPQSKWRCRLIAHLDSRNESELRSMGFPQDWKNGPFWNPDEDRTQPCLHATSECGVEGL